MPKRISKRPSDVNQAAYLMVERSVTTDEPKTEEVPKRIAKSEISRVMSAMGRRGGKIGGKGRLVKMTPEARSQVALKAAQARWAKRKREAS